ncbi:hypothetical protein EH223_00120 [candidate division KSB1 bacterium]|nr:hypothetical protein [candidate division KSB1 bacterium]RQW07330.1 MAG: hypothetical protein EH223_00120 [candidate division KSB1 bacterium]
MFDRILEPAKKFITVVGSSVGGFTALFLAAGFMAERLHLSILGISEVSISNQDFVMTGGKFYLTLIPSFILGLLSEPAIVAILLIVMVTSLIVHKIRQKRKKARKSRTAQHRAIWFILIQCFLFLVSLLSLFLSFRVLEFQDILYAGQLPDVFMAQNSDSLTPFHQRYQLLVILTIFFLIAAFLTEKYQKEYAQAKNGGTVSHILAFYAPFFFYVIVLFQILMLPLNFGGMLCVSKSYPIVTLTFSEENLFQDIRAPFRCAVLNESDEELMLYSPLRCQCWRVKKTFIREIRTVTRGNLFNKKLFTESTSISTDLNKKGVP